MKNLGIIIALSLICIKAKAVRKGIKTHIPDQIVTLQIHKVYTCTGLRISQNYIVTAAHCLTAKAPIELNSKKKGTVLVRYADNGRIKTYNTKTSKAIIKGATLSEELAILYIGSNNSNYIAPEISSSNTDTYLKDYLFYGYGYNEYGVTKKLRKGYLNSIGTQYIDGNLMVVMEPGSTNQHPCPGDSGGPVFTPDGKSLGIVSFINNSSQSIRHLSATEQCKIGNRSYFIYLSEHLNFLSPYL